MRVLFDDGIDPDVFSPVPDANLGPADRRIGERIRASSFVVSVRVVTVTAEHADQNSRIELDLLPVERPIHGDLATLGISGEPIKVYLGPTSAGYALVQAAQGDLVGKRMNLCWARFEDGGETVEHWHALSDAPKTKLALTKAAAIVNFE
jgi:hypothetical protein